MLQGDGAVAGGLVVADAEMLFEIGEYGVATHHGAQRVGADPDQILASGAATVHGIEAAHRRYLGAGQPQLLTTEFQSRRRQVGVFGLYQVQQRQQRRALVGVTADDLLGVDLQPRADVGRIGLRRTVNHELVGFFRWRAEPDEYPLPAAARDARRHRSTPPITGSMLATAVIKSATIPPSDIAATACKFVNEGSR